MKTTSDVLEQVRKTKEAMLKNFDNLLARGDKLEALGEKTATLEQQAKLFAQAAYDLQERAKSRYMSMTFILIGVSLGSVYTIAMSYSGPVIFLGALLGGMVGFTTSLITNWFSETFFLHPGLPKPTSSESHHFAPEDDLEVKLGSSNSYLNGFTASHLVENAQKAAMKEVIKSRFKI